MPKTEARCQEIREEMRTKILKQSMLYFARNGFAGTKISDLARQIGIGQGTIYLYFKSKEELFQAIFEKIQYDKELKELKVLQSMPISAKQKIHILSKSVISLLEQGEIYAARVALYAQTSLEKNNDFAQGSTYQAQLYQYTEKIMKQGQREGTVVNGSTEKLTDYYWSVVYLYSIKLLFTSKFEMITVVDLERVVLHD